MLFLLVALLCIYDTASQCGRSGWLHVIVAGVGYLVSSLLVRSAIGPGPDLILAWLWVGAVFVAAERGLVGEDRLPERWQCPDCGFFQPPTTPVCPCGKNGLEALAQWKEKQLPAIEPASDHPAVDHDNADWAVWAVPRRIGLMLERHPILPSLHQRLSVVMLGAALTAAVFLLVLFQLVFITLLTSQKVSATSGAFVWGHHLVTRADIESFRNGTPLQIRYRRDWAEPGLDMVVEVEALAGGRARCDGTLIESLDRHRPGPWETESGQLGGDVIYVVFLSESATYGDFVAVVDWLTSRENERIQADDIMRRHRYPPIFLGTD
jgi:hypothetical protein